MQLCLFTIALFMAVYGNAQFGKIQGIDKDVICF